MTVERSLLYIGPELSKSVASHTAQESVQSTQGSVAVVRFAIGTPGVGKKVVAGYSHQARVCRSLSAIRSRGGERGQHNVAEARLKRLIRVAKIAWIFSP